MFEQPTEGATENAGRENDGPNSRAWK